MKKSVWLLVILATILLSCQPGKKEYLRFEGPVFGTYFHITYEFPINRNLNQQMQDLMAAFNTSLSNYDPNSVISRMNQNDTLIKADDYFTVCFRRAQEISRMTEGAFDITVAPLVNLWGFGFTARDSATPEKIDSLLLVTGYEKVHLENGRLIKDDPRIMLDVSAIAKGYAVDVLGEFLERKGVVNYLVEIGGELRCRGQNPKGEDWKVGIDKPIENLAEREIQSVLSLSDAAMATSGNYRQFYEVNGIKFSHTIDPQSGFPVRHSLLSATVVAPDCMSADAFATAFMVMGLEKSKSMILINDDLEGVLIYSGQEGELLEWVSPGLADRISDL